MQHVTKSDKFTPQLLVQAVKILSDSTCLVSEVIVSSIGKNEVTFLQQGKS
jgi:hypothetical protein